MAEKPDIEAEARRLADRLPDAANRDDLAYEVGVRQTIDAGLAEANAGRLAEHGEALARVHARIHRAM